MLPMLFRGVFLLTVIAWYSNSLWKMIDVYFKEQFQRFLNDEFDKNPRMREDVLAAASLDDPSSFQPPPTESPPLPAPIPAGLEELLEAQSVPLATESEAVEADSSASSSAASDAVAVMGENGVAEPLHDETEPEPPEPRSIVTDVTEEANLVPVEQVSETPESEQPQQEPAQKVVEEKQRKPHQSSRKRKSSVLPQIGPVKSGDAVRRRRKQLQITLSSKDFASASWKRRNRYRNEDEEDYGEDEENEGFEEFDEDNDEKTSDDEQEDGVLVAELPFKPAIDLYDLEKLSPEEYCPLSLEEDPTCEQTQPWPSSASTPKVF